MLKQVDLERKKKALAAYWESMLSAKEMIEFLHSKPEVFRTNVRFYDACLAGIVACYARAFVDNNGLSKFTELENFGDEEGLLKRTHDRLIITRHKMVAHIDASYEFEQHGKNYRYTPVPLTEVDQGRTLDPESILALDDEFDLGLLSINPENLPLIKMLIFNQLRKLATISRALKLQLPEREHFQASPPASSSPSPGSAGK